MIAMSVSVEIDGIVVENAVLKWRLKDVEIRTNSATAVEMTIW